MGRLRPWFTPEKSSPRPTPLSAKIMPQTNSNKQISTPPRPSCGSLECARSNVFAVGAGVLRGCVSELRPLRGVSGGRPPKSE